MSRLILLLFVCNTAVAQQPTANYVMRVREFRMKQISCAVLTADGKVRLEVQRILPVESAEMYEGPATEADRQVAKYLLGRPEVQQTKSNMIPSGRVGQDGRMVTIEFVNNGKPMTSVFLNEDGRKSAPTYILQALDFFKALSKQKLAKLPRGTATLCPVAAAR